MGSGVKRREMLRRRQVVWDRIDEMKRRGFKRPGSLNKKKGGAAKDKK